MLLWGTFLICLHRFSAMYTMFILIVPTCIPALHSFIWLNSISLKSGTWPLLICSTFWCFHAVLARISTVVWNTLREQLKRKFYLIFWFEKFQSMLGYFHCFVLTKQKGDGRVKWIVSQQPGNRGNGRARVWCTLQRQAPSHWIPDTRSHFQNARIGPSRIHVC